MGKKDKSRIEEILHKELIKSAEKIPGTEAIYKGVCPEEGSPVYYFLIPGKYSPEISDLICKTDMRLSRRYPRINFSIMRWPIKPQDAVNYPFLGKCIYQKINNP